MTPLVSAIMPTRGRPQFAPLAVSCYLAQTHSSKELLIIDDEDDPSFPNGIEGEGIRYWQDKYIRYNIPQKLNRLCELAAGEVICRFDDDDWSAPDRIETQLARLLESGLSITGFHSMVFVDDAGALRKYRGTRDICMGSSMMFRRSYWQGHRWAEKKFIGSDNAFAKEAAVADQLISVDAGRMMYARAHAFNTSPKTMHLYGEVGVDELPAVLCQ